MRSVIRSDRIAVWFWINFVGGYQLNKRAAFFFCLLAQNIHLLALKMLCIECERVNQKNNKNIINYSWSENAVDTNYLSYFCDVAVCSVWSVIAYVATDILFFLNFFDGVRNNKPELKRAAQKSFVNLINHIKDTPIIYWSGLQKPTTTK